MPQTRARNQSSTLQTCVCVRVEVCHPHQDPMAQCTRRRSRNARGAQHSSVSPSPALDTPRPSKHPWPRARHSLLCWDVQPPIKSTFLFFFLFLPVLHVCPDRGGIRFFCNVSMRNQGHSWHKKQWLWSSVLPQLASRHLPLIAKSQALATR